MDGIKLKDLAVFVKKAFKKPFAQKRLCLTMRDWPNLFSLAKSFFIGQIFFFTGQFYFVKYMMYVPGPQKLRKNHSLKNSLFVNVGRV